MEWGGKGKRRRGMKTKEGEERGGNREKGEEGGKRKEEKGRE